MDIRKIEDGEIITEPGVYDMSLEWYHADCCDGPSISSSGLRTIDQKSPAHYWASSPLNPDYEPPERSKTLDFGKAAHCLLLTPELFEKEVAVCPFAGPLNRNETIGEGRAAVTWKAGEKQNWVADRSKEGRAVASQADMEKIIAMRDVLAEEPLIQNGLFQGEIEKALIWKDKETGVWLKSRLDVIPDDDVLADYKTCADGHPEAVERALYRYGYERQFALGAEGMWEVLRKKIAMVCVVFQEKDEPHVVTPIELELVDIYDGFNLNRRAIRKFAECLKESRWPGYADGGVRMVNRPKWLADTIRYEREAGLLPDLEPPFLISAEDKAACAAPN